MQPFQKLAIRWPSTLVAREELHTFSGGLLNSRTMANLDSQGLGPKGRIRVGRIICYPVETLIEWLETRSEQL